MLGWCGAESETPVLKTPLEPLLRELLVGFPRRPALGYSAQPDPPPIPIRLDKADTTVCKYRVSFCDSRGLYLIRPIPTKVLALIVTCTCFAYAHNHRQLSAVCSEITVTVTYHKGLVIQCSAEIVEPTLAPRNLPVPSQELAFSSGLNVNLDSLAIAIASSSSSLSNSLQLISRFAPEWPYPVALQLAIFSWPCVPFFLLCIIAVAYCRCKDP